MLIGVVFRRLWRERRQMSVLLVAISLCTAFLALTPLYVRAISGADLKLQLESLSSRDSQVEFINTGRFSESTTDLVQEHLGQRITGTKVYTIANQAYTNGVLRAQPAAYADFDTLFERVEGRMPMLTAGSTVEVVITRQALELIRATAPELADFGLESRLSVGDGPETLTAIIVGIVESTIPPDDLFWSNRERRVFGVRIPTLPQDLADFMLLTRSNIYNARLAPNIEAEQYFYQVNLDAGQLDVDNIRAFDRDLQATTTALRTLHPELEARSAYFALIASFKEAVQETERPVLMMAFLILALMLYNLITTISLVLEQQSEEWATIASRGGSYPQIIGIHMMTVFVLAFLAALLGPFIAQGILLILSLAGPQALILNSSDVIGLNAQSFLLSAIAALLAVLMLSIPAWSLVRTSLLTLKRSTSRPPSAPAWTRYFLDLMLLIIGAGFILRLYGLVSEDENVLSTLLADPGALARTLAQQGSETLSDPFNLLGPALLLTGAALLWIRIFPLLMRFLGFLMTNLNDLTTSLAVWNVERDPGHYGQLVLLIIGTLALGTASLSLIETRNSGALSVARRDTGGDVRLWVNSSETDMNMNWLSLPQTVSALPVLAAEYANAVPGEVVTLFGVDVQEVESAFPQVGEAMTPLSEESGQALPGVAITEMTSALSVDVFTEAQEETDRVELELSALLMNQDQVLVPLPLSSPDNGLTGEFIHFRAEVPRGLGMDWRFVGLQFSHRLVMESGASAPQFIVTSYFDSLTLIGEDGEESLLSGFEDSENADWSWPEGFRTGGTILMIDPNRAAEGAASLRMSYQPRSTETASLRYKSDALEPLPVLVSPAFANTFGMRSPLRRSLRAGDVVTSEIAVSITRSLSLNYRVVGVIDLFPSVDSSDPFIVTRLPWLQLHLNRDASLGDFYGINQVWLELENPQPSSSQRAAFESLPGLNDIEYAWTRYQEIQRDPLSNGITGMLFAGFWVSLGLILLDFAFYMMVTTRRRAVSMAVLRALGWDRQNIWRMLTVEQAAFITPALFVGFALGSLIAYLILPFLALVGGNSLQIPLLKVGLLLAALVMAFTLLLAVNAVSLQRMDVNRVLRQQE